MQVKNAARWRGPAHLYHPDLEAEAPGVGCSVNAFAVGRRQLPF